MSLARSPHFTRPIRALAVAALLATAVAGPSVAGKGDPAPEDETFVGAGGYTYPSPTNAAKVYQWGVPAWLDEYETRGRALREGWRVSRAGTVVQQQGQITMDSTGRGAVTAAATDTAAAYGRWETRVRAKRYDAKTPYRFFWELVPTRKPACGTRADGAIVIASWAQDDAQAVGRIGVSKDVSYTFAKDLDLRKGYFHTFAIEIAPDHVSWFVDREVVATERRPEALTGLTYRPRLRMQGVPGAAMARSRMQADWVRYYTLDRPGKKSIEAPEMTRVEVPTTC